MRLLHVMTLCSVASLSSYWIGSQHGSAPSSRLTQVAAPAQVHDSLLNLTAVTFPSGYRPSDRSPTADELPFLVAEALSSSNETDREILFSSLLQGVDSANALALEQVVRSQTSGWEQQRRISAILYAWAMNEGAVAADHVWRQRENDPHASARLGAAIRGWATHDPDAARTWMGLHDGGDHAHLTQMLVKGWAQKDHKAATDYVETLISTGDEQGIGVNRAINALTEAVFRKDPATATQWAETLEDTHMARMAFSGLAHRRVQQDLRSAARWAQALANEPRAHEAIGKVAKAMASDPQLGTDWSLDLNNAEARAIALEATMEQWAFQDPQGASELIAQLADSPERDHAINAFATTIAAEDPEAAVVWAASISDPEIRRASLIKTGQIWYQQDRHAAHEWVTTTDLQPVDQESVTLAFDESEFGF